MRRHVLRVTRLCECDPSSVGILGVSELALIVNAFARYGDICNFKLRYVESVGLRLFP